MFQACYATLPRQLPLKFALPGAERQDSVYNGFQVIDAAAELVAIHDSARPLIAPKDAVQCFLDALKVWWAQGRRPGPLAQHPQRCQQQPPPCSWLVMCSLGCCPPPV